MRIIGLRQLLCGLALVPCFGPLAGCQQPALAPMDSPVQLPLSDLEGAAHGFPELRSLAGERLADGDFTQWTENGRLHIRIRYEFDAQHWIEEYCVVQQEPLLVQERWSWTEMRGGELQRRFDVDFLAGTAAVQKREEGELRRWTKSVELERGRSFAGAAFTLGLKSLRQRLMQGEAIELQTVGFLPKPKVATLAVSYAGLDSLSMAGRTVQGERYVLHPQIPWVLRPFIEAPDTRLWLVHPEPAAFLRWEGPLAEPGDEIVRVDLLPGDPSGPAVPVPLGSEGP